MIKVAPEDMLPQRFYRHAQARPDAVYLTQPMGGGVVQTFTFGRVMDEAKRVATYLNSLNLPPQSNIGILTKNCAWFFITDLAIWMAGHVSVALYPTLTADTVRYILEHSESKLLFVGKIDGFGAMKEGIPSGLPTVTYPLCAKGATGTAWDTIIKDNKPLSDTPPRKPEDMSLIVYTSGSTGKPKGVVHTFQSISVPTEGLVGALKITQEDRALSYLPLAHTMDRWLSECVSMWVASQVFFAESLETFVADLQRARPTIFVSVPRLWLKFQLGVLSKMPQKKLDLLLKIPVVSGIVKNKILTQLGLNTVRFAGSGSAPIPAPLIQWYRDLGLELLEGYGMSENFNYSHMTKPGTGRPGYIGQVHPGVECRLSPEGEIQVKSPGMMTGYYRLPDATKETFTDDGWLRTGDRGEVDPEGRLKITGRVKELFKTSKGKYVAPAPIENAINSDNHVELCVVAGNAMQATHAVVQLAENLLPKVKDQAGKDEVTKALEALLAQVNSTLPDFERLDFIAVAKDRWSGETGELTPTMKIKRSVLEAKYQPQWEGWYASRAKVIWE